MDNVKFRFAIKTRRSPSVPQEETDEVWFELIKMFNNHGKADDVNEWINKPEYLQTLEHFKEIDKRIQVNKIKFEAIHKGGAGGHPAYSHHMTSTMYSATYVVIGDNLKLINDNTIQALCTIEGNTIPLSLSFPIQEQNGIQVEILRG